MARSLMQSKTAVKYWKLFPLEIPFKVGLKLLLGCVINIHGIRDPHYNSSKVGVNRVGLGWLVLGLLTRLN